MKKQLILQRNTRALYLALSISLSSLTAFSALEPLGSGEISPINQKLFKAIEKNKPDEVARLLSEGAHIDARDRNGNMPLHLATRFGLIKIAELLIDRGAAIEVTDNFGCTPLHRAAFNGHEKVIHLLISKNANIEAKDHKDFTPLHYAIIQDRGAIVGILLDAETHKEVPSNKGSHLLMLAVDNDSAEAVKILLGANFQRYLNINILKRALKANFKWSRDSIICMLLLQHTKDLPLEVRNLLTLYSFDLLTFEKNKKCMDEYFKELRTLFEVRCRIPYVIITLIYEYYNYFDLRVDFFRQAKSPRKEIYRASDISTFLQDEEYY